MTEQEVRETLERKDKEAGFSKISEMRDKLEKFKQERMGKEKNELYSMLDTATKQLVDKERQLLRLEAMKLAVQAGAYVDGTLKNTADDIYTWITKTE